MSKKSDNSEMLPVRIGIGVILFVVLLFMFVINPNENADKFSSENMWEAVHPWKLIPDTIALIGLILFGLFLTGYLGKVFSLFTDLSVGVIKAIAAVSASLMLLFYA